MDSAATNADNSLPSRSPVSEPAPPPAPVRHLETVTIPADAVIGVQLETSISTVKAKVEDPVRARVTRDLSAGGNVVVPAGSRLLGSVTLVEQGGRVKERARLGIRFHTLVLADGTEVRLPTETIYREGESPAGQERGEDRRRDHWRRDSRRHHGRRQGCGNRRRDGRGQRDRLGHGGRSPAG